MKRRTKALKAVIPSWIAADHPLHLNATIRKRILREFDRSGIFLNIPYAKGYSTLEMAIVSTVTAYDLTPHMARERTRMEVRVQKIVEIMLICRYGLTDLSYVRRMNMPLELGMLLAFGKETFVMTSQQYAALKTVSDLNFCDIHHHGKTISRLINGLSRWIEQNCSQKRLTTKTLIQRYKHLREIRQRLGQDFDRLPPQAIAKLLGVVKDEFNVLLPDA
jgi:hypothetical protein